jgi:hypothetical protein
MAKPKFSAFELRRNATYRVIAAFVDYDGNTQKSVNAGRSSKTSIFLTKMGCRYTWT